MKQRLLLSFLLLIIIFSSIGCNDVSYVDKSHNTINFSIPDDWIQSSSSSDNATLYLNNEKNADITLTIADTACNNMTLQNYTVITTRSYSSAFVTYSGSTVTTSDKENISNVSVGEPDYLTINDIEVSKTSITYDYTAGDKQYNFTEIICCCIVDEQIYQFNFKVRTEEFSSYEDIVNTIINSIKK